MKAESSIKAQSGLVALDWELILAEDPSVRGWVRASWEDMLTGEIGTYHDKKNLVVNGGRDALANLLLAPQTTRHLTTFKIGTKGHSGTDTLTPVAPTVTDAALIDTAPYSQTITPITQPTTGLKNEVLSTIILEPGVANAANGNPVVYTEAGLFLSDGTMFSRETFVALVKTNTRRVTFQWSILF